MFSLPEKYKKDKHILIKPFLNETLSASEKKRFKESIAEMSILYQIEVFDIPNLVNDDYHCEAIAFLDIKLTSMKAAVFVGNIVQKQVKMLCVIRFRDGTDECYCFAHKRLNKQNTTQIVVECTYSTGCMPCAFDNQKKTLFSLYIDYGTILNRSSFPKWIKVRNSLISTLNSHIKRILMIWLSILLNACFFYLNDV